MTTSGEDRAARTDGGSTVRQSGIEVGKSYEDDRFPVPAISLTIRSEREDPVTVRLADRVPEEVSMDDVGFHPEYGSEFWSVDGHTLVFERELAPEEEVETVYGLRGPDAEEPDRFLGDPTIEVRSGAEGGSDEDGGGGALLEDVNEPLVRSATFEDDGDEDATTEEDRAGDPEARNANEDTNGEAGNETAGNEAIGEETKERSNAASEGDRDPETENAGEADGPGTAVAGAAASATSDTGGETDGKKETTEDELMTEEGRPDIERIEEENAAATNADAGPVPDEEAPNPPAEPTESASSDGIDGSVGEGIDTGEGLAAALARELRAGRIDSEDRETLREVLGPRDSVAVRIDRLGSQVEELAAYADALESFIDENGAARQLVRRQSERLDVLDEEIGTVEKEATTNRADIERVEGEVETTDETVATLGEDIAAFQDAIADLDADVERIDGRFEDVEGNFDEVEERFETVENRLETLGGRADDAEERLERMDDRLDAIDDRLGAIEATHESDLEELREDLQSQVDERVADTERSVESVAADVEALESWRAQLSAVVGRTDETDEGREANDAEAGTDGDTTTATETDSE